MGESLQQFRGSALDQSRPPADNDEVLLETGRLDLGTLD
jgi:hypothetical protein